jgi:hypothetical protein
VNWSAQSPPESMLAANALAIVGPQSRAEEWQSSMGNVKRSRQQLTDT